MLLLRQVFTLLGFHEFMPSSEILSKLEGQMCSAQPYLCVNLLSIICGYNPDNLNVDHLPTYLNFTPSGTSVKNMAKWAQVGEGRGSGGAGEVKESCSVAARAADSRHCSQAVAAWLRLAVFGWGRTAPGQCAEAAMQSR